MYRLFVHFCRICCQGSSSWDFPTTSEPSRTCRFSVPNEWRIWKIVCHKWTTTQHKLLNPHYSSTTQSTTNKQPEQNTWKFKVCKVFLCFGNLFPISCSISTTFQSTLLDCSIELLNWQQTSTTQLNTRNFKGFEVFLYFGNVFWINCSINTIVQSILLNC